MMPNDPIFEPGARVVSFRGEAATVVRYREVPVQGKSNRVTVKFDGADAPDPREFYASVFSAAQAVSA